MKTKRDKNQQYKRIVKIIESCRTVEHIQNCEVILKNFFRMHQDLKMFTDLRMELKQQFLYVS